jgi:regulatory protein YycH of two-component signal transduction system YycFG
MTDIIERAEIVLKVPGIIIGKGLVQDLVDELKQAREEKSKIEQLVLDVEDLLAVATIYLDAFDEDDMVSITEAARLQKIEEIVERRGKRY